MMTPHYRHTQTGWVIIGSIAAAILLVVPLLRVDSAPPRGALFVAVPLVLAGLLFSTLTVEVDAQEVRVFFTGGLIRRRIALAEINGQRPVRNPWIYGWGIHKIPGGWIWNVSGLDAVELELVDGRVLRVGTNEPEALSRAITQVAPAAGTAAAHRAAPRTGRRSHWLAIVAAAVLILGVCALVGSAYLQTRPPDVTITAQQLSIRSLFYGDDYPLAEITEVSLEGRLPRILARTNGFAASGLLRGWFRLEGLGDGKLFVDVGSPPFLVVRLKRSFVILNLGDPEQTRAVYTELERMRRP